MGTMTIPEEYADINGCEDVDPRTKIKCHQICILSLARQLQTVEIEQENPNYSESCQSKPDNLVLDNIAFNKKFTKSLNEIYNLKAQIPVIDARQKNIDLYYGGAAVMIIVVILCCLAKFAVFNGDKRAQAQAQAQVKQNQAQVEQNQAQVKQNQAQDLGTNSQFQDWEGQGLVANSQTRDEKLEALQKALAQVQKSLTPEDEEFRVSSSVRSLSSSLSSKLQAEEAQAQAQAQVEQNQAQVEQNQAQDLGTNSQFQDGEGQGLVANSQTRGKEVLFQDEFNESGDEKLEALQKALQKALTLDEEIPNAAFRREEFLEKEP